METFKSGDVVRLKSGGPDMTIEKVKEYVANKIPFAADCVWFDGEVLKRSEFKLDNLVLKEQV